MIVLDPNAPHDGAAVVAEALADLNVIAPPDPMAGGAVVDLYEPLGVYGLSRADFRASGFAAATRTGWRYIVAHPDGEQTSYVDVSSDDARTRFSKAATNENANALVRAATEAERLAEPLPGDCELRVIEIPELKVAALWIVHQNAIFIPFIDGAVGRSMVGQALDEAAFVEQLQSRIPPAPALRYGDTPDMYGG